MPRREDNNPKTIDQIHREVQLEEQQRIQMRAEAPPPHPKRGSGGGGSRGRGPNSGGGGAGGPVQQPLGGEDGWQPVGKASRNILDPSRMKLTKVQDHLLFISNMSLLQGCHYVVCGKPLTHFCLRKN